MRFITPIYSEVVSGTAFLINCGKTTTREEIVGNGFFVDGNYFFTASHVIEDTIATPGKGIPYIRINNQKIELTPEKAIVYEKMPQNEVGAPINHQELSNGDISVFEIEGFDSSFILSDKLPEHGKVLKNAFYSKRTGKEEVIETAAIIHNADDFVGNFYAATMIPSHPTNGGSSGSPLYIGNKIYGILHAGGADKLPDICVFFSSIHALKLLKHNIY